MKADLFTHRDEYLALLIASASVIAFLVIWFGS